MSRIGAGLGGRADPPYSLVMKLRIRPLTQELWPALEEMFGAKGGCGGCWCMYWRIGPAYARRERDSNKADFRRVVADGPPPGLIAFDGDVAVGWCQLTKRDGLLWLDRAWPQVGDAPPWSISCFYVRIEYRRQGITSSLIREAIKTARRAGAKTLEAYPLDGDLSSSASGTGYVSTFERAGFEAAAHRSPARPVMRLDLKKPRAGG